MNKKEGHQFDFVRFELTTLDSINIYERYLINLFWLKLTKLRTRKICFKKCVRLFINSELENAERACMISCTNKFLQV